MIRPKDVAARLGTGFHAFVYRTSGGRVFGRAFGMPVVMLTTTGRKTGKRRTTMLTAPLADDDQIVLVASYGGDEHHPAWFLNLRDHPDVEVTIDGRDREMRARVASSDEKAELWPRIIKAYKSYGSYQKRTERDIPVVILEPRGGKQS